jgi:hypothetical protein
MERCVVNSCTASSTVVQAFGVNVVRQGENRLQLLKREERRGVVFCIFSRGSKKNGGHLHQIFYFTSAAYRMPEQTRPG